MVAGLHGRVFKPGRLEAERTELLHGSVDGGLRLVLVLPG
jgi:hypothetical protein